MPSLISGRAGTLAGGAAGQPAPRRQEAVTHLRRLVVVYLAFVASQFATTIDPTLRNSWAIHACAGLLALTGLRIGRISLEVVLWIRLLAVPFLYLHFGSSLDVLGPGVACALFAYGVWVIAGRSRLSFALPLAVPLVAIASIRWLLIPAHYPDALVAARVQGTLHLSPLRAPDGWTRYHCPGYSIAIPAGMTSGFVGGGRGNIFSYHNGRPTGETLGSMSVRFARITGIAADPEIAAMAAHVLGVVTEFEYARYVLSVADGFRFLDEKTGWLGNVPPPEIHELRFGTMSGFVFFDPGSNWGRVVLYFDSRGREHSLELALYGDLDTPLARERIFQQVTTIRVEPGLRDLPTLAGLRASTRDLADHSVNVTLSSMLSLNADNFEALYFLAVNQRRLGRLTKAGELMARVQSWFLAGRISSADLGLWKLRYGSIGDPTSWQ